MTRVLITGGAGFLAKHLARLLMGDHKVTLLDVKAPSGELPARVGYVRCNVLDFQRLSRLLTGVDAVVHLAGFLGVAGTENFPLMTLETNIIGTRNVLKASVDSGVSRFVFSSSSEVYGEPVRVPISEDSPKTPRSVYGVSKLAAEEYVRGFGKQYGIQYTICRIFNAYGPGQSRQFVIPSMIYQCLNSGRILVYGDGKQIRSFCYAVDVAKALRLIMSASGAIGETLNIGNPKEPISMSELARLVKDICCKDAKTVRTPYKNSDRDASREIRHRIPDISKLTKITGFKPRYSLRSGIESTYASLFDETRS